MADDRTKRGRPDRLRVSATEDYEIAYIAKRFGITRKAAIRAIKNNHNIRKAVYRALSK